MMNVQMVCCVADNPPAGDECNGALMANARGAFVAQPDKSAILSPKHHPVTGKMATSCWMDALIHPDWWMSSSANFHNVILRPAGNS